MVNPAAERAVLAGICVHGSEVFADVADLISQSSTFSDEINQAIYRCFQQIYENNTNAQIDLASIYAAAQDLKLDTLLNRREERNYVQSLFNYGAENKTIEASNVRNFAKIIKKLEITRQLHNIVSHNIVPNLEGVNGSESVNQILGIAENPVFDFSMSLNDASTEGPNLIGEGLDEYIQHIEENAGHPIGISTGFPILDAAIGGGLQRQMITLIGGRSKKGKSFLVDVMAVHIAGRLGIPCLILDSEMPKKIHYNRILARLTGITIDEIKLGAYKDDPEKYNKVHRAIEWLKKIPYHYQSINAQPFEDSIGHIRRWIKKVVGTDEGGNTNNCVIFYDYLKLMEARDLRSDLKEYQELGFRATTLHNIAYKHNIPMVVMSQVNRDGIHQLTSGIYSGSDRVLWLASNALIWKPKSEEEIQQDGGSKNGNYKMCVLDTRDGPGLEEGDYISMKFNKKIGRIKEVNTAYQLHNIQSQQEGFQVEQGKDAKQTQF